MADIADMAQDQIEQEDERNRRKIPAHFELPPGKAGDCDLCGRWSSRLIDGVCAPCRDRYKLK